MVLAFTVITSPPALVVSMVAVDSPKAGGVMNRDTNTNEASALIATWRTLGATSTMPCCAPVAAFNLSSCPVASNATNALVPFGSNAKPCGCDARGSVRVCTTASVVGLIIEMLALFLLVTQIRPSGATATVRGEIPTLIAVSSTLDALSNTLTESLSGLTTQILDGFPLRFSTVMGVEFVGFLAVLGVATACKNVRLEIAPTESCALSVTTYTPGCA